jgi:hypothetical protein
MVKDILNISSDNFDLYEYLNVLEEEAQKSERELREAKLL